MARFLRSYLARCMKVYRLSGGTAPSQEFPACGQLRDFELRDEFSRRSWPSFERTQGRVRHVLPNGRFVRRSESWTEVATPQRARRTGGFRRCLATYVKGRPREPHF